MGPPINGLATTFEFRDLTEFATLEAAASLMVDDGAAGRGNPKARIPVCGLISQYNATGLPDGPDRMSLLLGTILRKRMTLRGFIVFDDFGHLYPNSPSGWVRG